jgi:hypothetical protein
MLGDWTKSTGARLLSPLVFDLTVVDSRVETYPQELALRFACPMVQETYANWTFLHEPVDEIAGDLAALLTLFARRLIVVAVKTREIFPASARGVPDSLRDLPLPIRDATFTAWPPRPSSVITSTEVVDGKLSPRQTVKSYQPYPVAFDPGELTNLLSRLVNQPDELTGRLVAAARRYRDAMRFLPQNPDLAYLLLISAIEALSTLVPYEPPLGRVKTARKDLLGLLKGLGLSAEQIDQVFGLVARPMTWTQEKFLRFIETHVSDEAWTEPDPLYPGLTFPDTTPARAELREALMRIYRHRSSGSHAGSPYPAYVSIGTSPLVDQDAFRALRAAADSDRIPPVTWFERVVQNSLIRFIGTLEMARDWPRSVPAVEERP